MKLEIISLGLILSSIIVITLGIIKIHTYPGKIVKARNSLLYAYELKMKIPRSRSVLAPVAWRPSTRMTLPILTTCW
jgi:hypothetical protein